MNVIFNAQAVVLELKSRCICKWCDNKFYEKLNSKFDKQKQAIIELLNVEHEQE